LDDVGRVVAVAAEWLELDSPDEGIRFDAELVSLVKSPMERSHD
jgi:hypothetical protein